jgi:hypothetical protein
MLLAGCSGQKDPGFDYTAYRESNPKSILVLPPNNNSLDVRASYSLLSQTTLPLSEGGYYVLPVGLVAETFMHNGVTDPAEIHQLPIKKLYKIFGADTVLYIDIHEYGTKYVVFDSVTSVTAEAKLVDLRTGKVLWSGKATASDSEGSNNNQGGLIGVLAGAAMKQIFSNLQDNGHKIAGVTCERLLGAGNYNGLLYGPYKEEQNVASNS